MTRSPLSSICGSTDAPDRDRGLDRRASFGGYGDAEHARISAMFKACSSPPSARDTGRECRSNAPSDSRRASREGQASSRRRQAGLISDGPPLDARQRKERRGWTLSRLHEWTVALVQGTKCVFGLDRRDELEIVPFVLRFGGGLRLVEVHRMELSPVDADDSLAE